MSTRSGLLAAAFGVLLGGALGWGSAPATGSALPVVVAAPRAPRVVCTRSIAAEPEACDEVTVRADWCAARLRAASRPRPTTAPAEALGVDDPEAWRARLDTLLDACHVSARITNTDCAEYPCVSALALDAEAAAALESCTAPGFSADEWPALLPLPVDCGDGTTDTLWLYAVLDQPTLDELYPKAAHTFLPAELMYLGARRGEALARGWRACGT